MQTRQKKVLLILFFFRERNFYILKFSHLTTIFFIGKNSYLIASRSPPGQDCRRQAMKEQMVEKMKYSRRALWKRTATNMPEES